VRRRRLGTPDEVRVPGAFGEQADVGASSARRADPLFSGDAVTLIQNAAPGISAGGEQYGSESVHGGVPQRIRRRSTTKESTVDE
jgi:hypothetical protein